MNIKKIIFGLVVVTGHIFSVQVFAESSVWKISKGNNYLYLGGTVHILSQSDHPLPDEFYLAYKDANKIIFETDLIETQSMAFQGKLIAAMTYSDDRTLASELDAKTYKELERFLAERQIPITNFAKFQPWGLSLMIVTLEYQRLGMLPEYGVDQHFKKLAVADNKPIAGLETADEQLGFLRSMANMDVNEGIEYTLRDLERLPEFIKLIKNNWRSGDLEAFSKHAFIVQMKTEFPEMYNTLVSKRNKAWMKQLPSLIQDKNKEFVLVGAMHLNDTDGLLNQLKLKGYKVEQLRANK